MNIELSFKHRNLPEQVADHIVILMATDQLQPGQRLFENELCKLLGVSRVPVREALRLLQAQGIVRNEPNRGSFVSEYSSMETDELMKVRLSVEKLALRRLVRLAKSDPSILDGLERALDELRKQDKFNDKLAACQADLAFHNQIVELSGSPVLLPIWQSLSRGILVFFMHERQSYYDYARSTKDHELLMNLIRAGRISALDAEIERHILTASRATPEAV